MTAPVAYHLGGFPPPQLDWHQLIPLLEPPNESWPNAKGRKGSIHDP